jgi:hypothetical protein
MRLRQFYEPDESKGFYSRQQNKHVWGRGRAVWPPATSWLGGDVFTHWVAREASAGRLIGGDLGHFK